MSIVSFRERLLDSNSLHPCRMKGLLDKLLELLVPKTMASEATSLELDQNWHQTKVQALGSREDVPSTITVLGQEVAMVEEFVYLGSLVHSSTQSSPDISRRNAITNAARQNRDNQIWKSRISISTKLKLCNNTCILPFFLCGSECWAVTKRDVLKIDALDRWYLWKLLGIKWYHCVHISNLPLIRRK